MTTYATGVHKETYRVVVTGSFDGETELHEALDASGTGLEVVAWTAEVRDAVPYLGSDISAVLLGVGRDSEPVGAMLEADVAVIRLHTQAPIVLLVPEAHPDLVETAFTAGVDDVLVLPQLVETISFAIRKAHQPGGRHGGHIVEGSSEVPRGRIVTVFSPKGGTGKTVLSTNLAALLAHNSGKRVLLIDLDLQFGDAAIMLGIDPQRTMYELVLDPGELDTGKLEGYTTRHKSGLDVLAAPMRPEEAELVTESKVLRLLEVAREAYDLVVVDTSPFFYGPMLALLRPTDMLLLLCGLDVPTLKNVKLSLRTLELLGFPASRTNLVLNRVTPKVGLTKDDVEQALGIKVSFEIPNDPVVAPSVNRGAATVLSESDSEFAQAVALIAGSIESVGAASAPRGAEAPKRRWLTPRRLLEGRAS